MVEITPETTVEITTETKAEITMVKNRTTPALPRHRSRSRHHHPALAKSSTQQREAPAQRFLKFSMQKLKITA
jgi:hypothetical protein